MKSKEMQELVKMLQQRLTQLENDKTLSSYAKKSRMAEVKRTLKLICYGQP